MHKIILSFCLLLVFFHKGLGQSIPIDSLRNAYDQSYGLNTLLTNGKKYIPTEHPIMGHPFWKSEGAFLASITISGSTFTDQQLKYELNKQQFVLFYTNYNGQPGQIVLNNSVIDSVNMANCLFIPNINTTINQPFVQLIRKGKLSCTVSWSKDLILNGVGQNVGYQYSKEHSRYYLGYKGSDYRFYNKSSFLRIFNKKERAPIRKYLSAKHFKFKRMNDSELRKLIVFCEQTLN